MNLEKHKEEFMTIIKKYQFYTSEKAQEIANFLIKHTDNSVSAKEFANKYQMTENEAYIFLSFIQKGIKFKEEHLDKKD